VRGESQGPGRLIPFVKHAPPPYGASERISRRIRRVTANNPGPFTYTGTGTYIVGSGEVAVIDPGPENPEHLDALLAATQGEQMTHILVTHTHRDHSPLARELKARTGAAVIGRPAPGGQESEPRLDEGHDTAFAPDRILRDGEVIAGPGWTLRAIATPGHASNHFAFTLEQENALFSGDHVMGWSTTVVAPPDGDMGDYYHSLDKVAAEGFATLYPTHGPSVTEVAPFLAAYKAHRLERERQILEQLSAGLRHIPHMVRAIYAEVDPRLHPAAALSVLAHLVYLVRAGRVATSGAPTLEAEYRLALRETGG
jgi:glyoxylase-like metal-dependent hydrolase (beta-lactamase superfamily II)